MLELENRNELLELKNKKLVEAMVKLLKFAEEVSGTLHVNASLWAGHLSGVLEKFSQCDDYVIRCWARSTSEELDRWKHPENVIYLDSYRKGFAANKDDGPDIETLIRLTFFLEKVSEEAGTALRIWRRRMWGICVVLQHMADDEEVRERAEAVMNSMPDYVERRFGREQQ